MASLLFLSLSVTKLPHSMITIIVTTTSINPHNPTILKSHPLISPFPIHSSILFYPLPMPLLINSFIIFSPRFRRRITPVANHRKNDSIASTVKIEGLSFLEKISLLLKRFWLKLSCVQTSESSQPLVSFWSDLLVADQVSGSSSSSVPLDRGGDTDSVRDDETVSSTFTPNESVRSRMSKWVFSRDNVLIDGLTWWPFQRNGSWLN